MRGVRLVRDIFKLRFDEAEAWRCRCDWVVERMSDSDEIPAGAKEREPREAAARLWEEYSYRHDMIWKLVFRVTAVATALAVAPFLLDENAQDILKGWLAFLPALGIIVILLGFFALPSEFRMLTRVKSIYQWSQDETFKGLSNWKPHSGPERSLLSFKLRIYVFLSLILVGAVVFLLLFAFSWSAEL